MRRVLVVQLARIGDLVQTKRLLLTLRGEAEVHLCVAPVLAEFAGVLYPFAHVHTLPAHSQGNTAPEAVLRAARDTLAELRRLDFSAVYLLNFSPLSYAVAALFPPETTHGFACENGQRMYGDWPALGLALARRRSFAPLNLVDFWANLHPSPLPPEKVNPIPRPAGSRRVGIVMSGRETRRTLPSAQLAACAAAVFQARGGPSLVCIGAENDRPLVRRLARLLPPQAAKRLEDATGTTSIAELPDLIAGLDLLITPDTGAMHIAAHVGVPVQAFFLSSAWCFETGPYGFGHTVWQAAAPCSPCLESAPCGHSLRCLEPFGHAGFLAHLSGKYDGAWPEHLMGCVSSLDPLGVTYRVVDGEDPFAAERWERRAALAERLGVPGFGPPSPEVVEELFAEKRWMLPPLWKNA